MEELLASESQKLTNLFRGQQIEGEVVAISPKEITLDLGAKSEGILPAREVPREKLSSLKVGDKITVFVSWPENENGQTVLSYEKQILVREGKGGRRGGRSMEWSKFIQAQKQNSKMQGKVIELNKGGLIIEVNGTRGFLPNSQVGFELLSKSGVSQENLIGQDLTVTVIEVNQDNNKLIFSERGQVSEEALKKLKSFKFKQKVKGKVVAVLPFGLVVDVSGVEGLVFISDVSWDRVDDLTKVFTPGEEIEVLVVGLDEELGRLNLSIKQLAEDPFAKIAESYPADEVVKGEVTAASEAGITVQLKGAEGFLPASKMGADGKYEVGASMNFLVDSVDVNKRRINLAPFVISTAGLIYK